MLPTFKRERHCGNALVLRVKNFQVKRFYVRSMFILTRYQFASQTLRRKIMDNYRELPSQEARVQLRNKLIQFIITQTNPSVSTQLSLALADLCLQMPQEKESVSNKKSQIYGCELSRLFFSEFENLFS